MTEHRPAVAASSPTPGGLPGLLLATAISLVAPAALRAQAAPAAPRPITRGTAPGATAPGTALSTTTPGTALSTTTPGTAPSAATPGTAPSATAPGPTPRRADRPWARGVSPANQQTALAIFRQGNAFFEQSRYAEALILYERAVRYWDHPAIRFNMAVCQIRLRNTLAAWHDLERALRFGPGPLRQHYQPALTYRQLLEERLARVTIECQQPGARVLLDGELLLLAPGRSNRVLPVGKHVLVATLPGHLTHTRTLLLGPRQHLSLRVRLLATSEGLKLKQRWKARVPWSIFGTGLAVAALSLPVLLDARQAFVRFDQRMRAEYPGGLPFDQLPASMRRLISRGGKEKLAAWGLLASGGAITAVGVVLLILNRPQVEHLPGQTSGQAVRRPLWSLAPTAWPGGAGLWARGSF